MVANKLEYPALSVPMKSANTAGHCFFDTDTGEVSLSAPKLPVFCVLEFSVTATLVKALLILL